MSVRIDEVTKLTYEDYVHLPDDGRTHEIIDGDHYVAPAPGTYHQTLSRRIQFALYEQLEKNEHALVFNAPTDVELSKTDIVQPDLLVIGTSRRHIVSPSRVIGPPDLVIEIVSESSGDRDRELKLSLYERTGVAEYWIVEPEAQEIRRYTRKDERLLLEGTYHESIAYRCEGNDCIVDLGGIW